MNSYLVVESGPRVSIHDAKVHGVGFKSLDDAVDFIDRRKLDHVQIIARDGETGKRRWLSHAEQKQLGLSILRDFDEQVNRALEDEMKRWEVT